MSATTERPHQTTDPRSSSADMTTPSHQNVAAMLRTSSRRRPGRAPALPALLEQLETLEEPTLESWRTCSTSRRPPGRALSRMRAALWVDVPARPGRYRGRGAPPSTTRSR